MEPLTLSVSQVNAYLGCSLKYRFQYVDKIPRPWRASALAFGTSIHSAIEWIQRERLARRVPSLEGAMTMFEADWYAQTIDPLVFPEWESAESLQQQGREMLAVYLETPPLAAPLTIEEPFEIDLMDPETGEIYDIRLRGIMDLVEEDETVVDLKTAARAVSEGDLERHLQLSTYALAWVTRFGRIPKLRLDVLLKGKRPRLERHETSRTNGELAWTAQLIWEVARGIQHEHFIPNPSWRCTECEYFAHCQKWRGYGPLVQIHRSAEEGVGAVAT